VRLPGERLAFLIGPEQVGWVTREFAASLRRFPEIEATSSSVELRRAGALQRIALELSRAGHFRWRQEAFDIRATPDGPPVAQLDRGALPSFGVLALGVHVNGLVQLDSGLHLWIARRAANKLLDPGKLDHIVAGGVPAGLSPEATLVKEAAEEAGIPAALARRAKLRSTIGYAMQRQEGLRRDWLYCYDLVLPPDFVPEAADGEVAGFEFWPVERVMEAVRDTDAFKFNVNLVLIDLFLRLGLIAGEGAVRLRAALGQGML
jgi:thiamine pyrophosphokinase